MKYGKRWVAIGVTVAVGIMGLEYMAPVTASATQVDLACSGKPGDSAGPLGDSKTVLGLLPGSGGGLTFGVDIVPNAPEKVTPGAGPFNASFELTLSLPDSIVKTIKDTLKITTVTISEATFGVEASGAATASLSKTVSNLQLDLNQSPVTVKQTISGVIEPKSAGKITYKPGATQIAIALNVTSPVTIGTLTVVCGSSKEIGSTRVQVPGAPTVAPIIVVGGAPGQLSTKQLLPGEITPDSGNPIIPESLRVVSQPSNGGVAGIGGRGDTGFFAPATQGLYFVTHEVCAAARVVPAVAGVNAVQSMSWPESYVGRDFNAHPLSMALQFKGAKSKTIPLSFVGDAPYPSGLGDAVDNLFGQFRAPTAAALQAALEGIATIGKGNVAVTGGGASPYSITFIGALGGAEQPKVEVVDLTTWLPATGLATLLALLNPPAPKPGDPTTTTTIPLPVLTDAELDTKFGAGQITFDEWLAGRGKNLTAGILAGATTPENIKAITGLFPKGPEVQTATDGAAPIPEGSTGPLCSRFDVAYYVVNPPAAVQGISVARPASTSTSKTTCSTKKVRVKVNGRYKYVNKRLCYKTTCVTKPVKVRVKYKVNGKTKYRYQTVNKRVCTKKKA